MGLSIERCRTLLSTENFRILDEKLYLISPSYEVKFSLRKRRLPDWIGRIPYIRATTAHQIVLRYENV